MSEKLFTYDDGGKKLTVSIHKMDAFQSEKWLMRAAFLLGKDLSTIRNINDFSGIISAIASVGYENAVPLLDELLHCCYIKNGNLETKVDESVKELIQNPLTLTRMRVDSAKVNFDFFSFDDALKSLTN